MKKTYVKTITFNPAFSLAIPKEFTLIGKKITVEHGNAKLDKDVHGEARYLEDKIILSDNDELSERFKLQTFYHEVVHFILNEMGEAKLNNNEKFVDIFSKLLTEFYLTNK